MSLDTVFQQAIAAMDHVTKTVQETVRVKPWISEDAFGKPTYGATRKHKAVVDRNAGEVRTRDGRVLNVKAAITFLTALPTIGAPGRTEPIDVRDQIYLVDDLTGPIISIQGSTNNPGTTTRYFQRVLLG